MGTKTLIMMPGQGSQKKGMGKELCESSAKAKSIFSAASEALGYDMEKLCFDDPDDKLIQTEFTQPALLTVSVAMWEAYKEKLDGRELVFAGHSLGEISALVAAGYLPLTSAVRLVRKRGQEMQRACPMGKGAMAAVLKLSPEVVAEICSQVSDGANKAQPANFNSSGQTVISGDAAKVEEACTMVKEKGGKAIPLKVSAPFHSYLMEPAQKAMAGEIEGIDWQQAGASFIPNVNAQIQQSYNVNFLIDQITQPVRWVQTLSAAVAFGVAECLEFGPGKVLTGLAKRELKDKEVQCLHILDLS